MWNAFFCKQNRSIWPSLAVGVPIAKVLPPRIGDHHFLLEVKVNVIQVFLLVCFAKHPGIFTDKCLLDMTAGKIRHELCVVSGHRKHNPLKALDIPVSQLYFDEPILFIISRFWCMIWFMCRSSESPLKSLQTLAVSLDARKSGFITGRHWPKRSKNGSVIPTVSPLGNWAIMWCLEPNLVPNRTSRGAKSALWVKKNPLDPPRPPQRPPNPPKPAQWPSLQPI